MKNNSIIIEYLIPVLSWFEKVGITFVIGGLVGGIIQRMRKRMSFWKFINSLVIAMFVGWTIGSVLTSWFSLPERVVYAACALSGVFSEDLLNEVEKLVKYLSVIVKTLINKKIDNDSN